MMRRRVRSIGPTWLFKQFSALLTPRTGLVRWLGVLGNAGRLGLRPVRASWRLAGKIQFRRLRDLPSFWDVMRAALLAVGVSAPPVLLVWLLQVPPMGALPKASESTALLGSLLGAQAAIAALTLAVTLFVMQGVSARRDVDDRVYAEYVRRSLVRPIFWSSIGAVAVTGAVLTAEKLIGDSGAIARGVPGIPNLALVAVVALAVNLAAALTLFEKAVRLAQPDLWGQLRLDVNKRDVREAVRAFFGRAQRAAAAQAANEADFSVLFPDPGEGSADQAVRALLDDARRAMDERRHGEFGHSLDTVKELIGYAMDEIEGAGLGWGPPGSSADWPPLWELGRNLHAFREEVIRAGNREYVYELLKLDYWMVSTGLRRPCGELFTAGLNGYRWNYQFATRVGSDDVRSLTRDQFMLNLDGLTFDRVPEDLFPFMREVVRHQGRVLSDALHSGNADDFEWLRREFGQILSNILERWSRGVFPPSEESEWSDLLTQEYRITLMGLVGRALTLADSGGLSDVTPFLDAVRATYVRTADLVADISAALDLQRLDGFSLWRDWEFPDGLSSRAVSISPERYPLTCFSVLLMELAEGTTLTLDLRGNASQVLSWFTSHSETLERFVRDTPSASAAQRRELATEVLQRAVLHDEVEVERDMISRPVSTDRVGGVRSGVRAGLLQADSVRRLFDKAGVFVALDVDSDDLPTERGLRQLLPKAYFVDPVEYDKTHYAAIDGDDWGRRISHGVVYLLCEELEGVPPMAAPLDDIVDVLSAIDLAVADLDPQGDVAVVVAGNTEEVFYSLRGEEVEGYEPRWRMTGVDPLVEAGRYCGYPILRGPTDGTRRVYVVDVSTWGIYERASFEEGEEFSADVEAISPERARELLDANPDFFAGEPDDASRMRRMQAHVVVRISVRDGFRVSDPTRARRVSSDWPSVPGDAGCLGHCSPDHDDLVES